MRSLISGGGIATTVASGGVVAGGKDANSMAQLTIAGLEKKLLSKQEELTELHKRKGENSQLIVDLNVRVEKQQQTIAAKEKRCLSNPSELNLCSGMHEILLNALLVVRFSLSEQLKINVTLKAEVNMLQTNLEELKKLNNTLFDEHTALQLAFTALEEKMRGVQVRCRTHPMNCLLLDISPPSKLIRGGIGLSLIHI